MALVSKNALLHGRRPAVLTAVGINVGVAFWAVSESRFPSRHSNWHSATYGVTSWAEHPVGRHFPAVSEPELLARTLRDASRAAR